ncbi:MAG TPA: EXLDI protein [Ktedonobacteraceae bacterium]|jgi:EXLDI family protein|nr:EXLDI protein [Ktedonobacteraceae bacterium]
MPNRTIYVADADMPIFEKAQKLAGDNLSAAIAQALRIFVEREESRQGGFEDIIVKVGKGRPYQQKQFSGKLLAKRRVPIQGNTRMLTISVYQTAKGRFAVYTKNQPNWSGWSARWSKHKHSGKSWDVDVNVDVNPSGWQYDWWSYYQDDELRLDVYESLDDLKENIPEEMFDAIVRYLQGGDIEILDI